MEQRVVFSPGDLTYLANLCHNCGECLSGCQYAPPHEFGIDVPHTLSRVRVESYESFAWPSFAAVMFRKPWTAAIISLVFGAVLAATAARFHNGKVRGADFYAVIPHDTLVTVFGIIGLCVVVALAVGHHRFTVIADPKGPRRAGR